MASREWGARSGAAKQTTATASTATSDTAASGGGFPAAMRRQPAPGGGRRRGGRVRHTGSAGRGAVEQVGQEVEDDHCERPHQQDPHQQRVVPGEHRLNEQPADARPGEDRLGDDGSREEIGHVERHHRDHRHQRVPDRVRPDDPCLREPLRSGGLHVVRAGGSEQARSQVTGPGCDVAGGEHQGREQEVEQVIAERRHADRVGSCNRKPGQVNRKHQLQHQAEPEHRHRDPEERGAGREEVDQGVLPERAIDAEAGGHDRRQQEGGPPSARAWPGAARRSSPPPAGCWRSSAPDRPGPRRSASGAYCTGTGRSTPSRWR